jgi:hypothetical protein
MKNKILIFGVLILSLMSVTFTSCENETTAGFTRITFYPILEMQGDAVIILDKGATFNDPGAIAEINGEDISDQIEVISDLNTNEPGIYHITYSAINEDGFSVSAIRTIYVADPTPSIIASGMHTVADGTHRVNNDNGAITNYSGYSIIILQVEPGVFYISDFLAGYYDQHVGYGSNYAMTGHFQLNEDNSITPIDSFVAGWGDSMDDMSTSAVDPETGQITYSLSYAGFLDFNVIIN